MNSKKILIGRLTLFEKSTFQLLLKFKKARNFEKHFLILIIKDYSFENLWFETVDAS